MMFYSVIQVVTFFIILGFCYAQDDVAWREFRLAFGDEKMLSSGWSK